MTNSPLNDRGLDASPKRPGVLRGVSIRRIYWTTCVLVASGTAMSKIAIGIDRPAVFLAVFAVGAVLALAVELIGYSRLRSRSNRLEERARLVDPAMPDGEVGVFSPEVAETVPNAFDPRWKRIKRIESREPTQPAVRHKGPGLLGRIAIFSIFLGKDGKPWSDREIALAHRSIFRAGEWLEREAIAWNVPLNAVVSDAYFALLDDTDDDRGVEYYPGDGGLTFFDADAERKLLLGLSRAASALGQGPADLIERLDESIEADERIWLIHVRRAGRSYAIDRGDFGAPGRGLAVCYASEADLPEPLVGTASADSTTIVHELLHLFGASDKYQTSLRDFPKRTVSNRDVMRLDQSEITRLRIDPLTALEIGWIDDLSRRRAERPKKKARPGSDDSSRACYESNETDGTDEPISSPRPETLNPPGD